MGTEPITPEIMQEIPKKKRNRPPLNRKIATAVQLIAEHGVNPKEAYVLATGNTTVSRATMSRLNDKVQRYTLQSPQMAKLARNAVKDCLQGKAVEYQVEKAIPGVGIETITEKIIPTYSNKLAAAAMVADRIEPAVKRSENLNVNVDLHPVDLSRYGG